MPEIDREALAMETARRHHQMYLVQQPPSGIVSQPYKFQLVVRGGVPPYHYFSHALPPGLTLDRWRGLIAGTPLAAGQAVIVITDSEGSW